MEEWKLLCYAESNKDGAGCSSSSFSSPLAFLGKAKPLKDMTQEEIDQAWSNVYGNAQVWDKMKAMY